MQEPSFGDIMIDDDGVVKVYYTDGTTAPVWAPICADTFSTSAHIVICRQLGFEFDPQAKTLKYDVRV